MLPKIKRFIKNNKKLVKLCVILLIILVILLILFKMLFYSSSEKSVYGVRLRDIKQNEFTKEENNKFKENASNIAGVEKVSVSVKGRLIKVFATFEGSVSTDDIKAKFNEMLGSISEKVKGYYDITFYAVQVKDEKEIYPVIGYKHKSKSDISFDVL